ncbi:TPA: hypothetical protein L8P68_003618 [Klebsiella pneumoniae]|nr:hypothetical protein [Klebsiella pneumoniae]
MNVGASHPFFISMCEKFALIKPAMNRDAQDAVNSSTRPVSQDNITNNDSINNPSVFFIDVDISTINTGTKK